ncbi:MAG TPA: zinc-ribbon domain-containing protein [Pseudonocardiaceae bacterium]
MRACPVCGSLNGETDDFCGNCGSYLGWSGTVPEPAAGENVGPVRPGAAPPPAPPAPPGRTPGAAAGRAEPVDSPAESANRVPPVEANAQPGPRQPARPATQRPVSTQRTAEAAVDGPPCPVCGTPNSPERQFCRHCAAPLHPTAAPTPAGWRPFRRRRGIGGRWGRIARRVFALLVIVALIVAVVAFLPAGQALFQTVLDKLGHASPVAPVQITANADAPGHPARAAADGATNRYWGAPAVGDYVDFTFASPVRLLDVIITPGASTDPDQFNAQGRPTSMDLIATDNSGQSTTKTFALADRPGPQTFGTGISNVIKVRLVVRAATGLGPGRVIAVGEVEFFRRS